MRIPRLSIWLVPLVLSLAVVGTGVWQFNLLRSSGEADTEVRVAVRPLDDGRTEVALQQRAGSGWGERLTPDARFLPPDAERGRWLVSSPVSLALDDAETEPLKIAFIQSVGGTDHERRNSFRLAIRHINAAGGVLGQPVVGVIADINFDTDFAVAVARRLVEEEGVHAFVGPNTSAASLAVIEAVIEPLGIPTISPSATAPALTEAPRPRLLLPRRPLRQRPRSGTGPTRARTRTRQRRAGLPRRRLGTRPLRCLPRRLDRRLD